MPRSAEENVEAQKIRVPKSGKSASTLFIVLLAFLAAASAQLQVKTKSGALEGAAEGGIVSFKGIPFVAPPVGKLRWRAPQPPAVRSGVRNADQFGTS